MGTVQHNHNVKNQPFSMMFKEPSTVPTCNWPTSLTHGMMTITITMMMMMMDRNFSSSDIPKTGKVTWLPHKLPMVLHNTCMS